MTSKNLQSFAKINTDLKIVSSILWNSIGLELCFEIYDPQGHILFPSAKEVACHLQRRHELWKHTCFEAFLRPPHSNAYFEMNMNTAFEWNVYEFSDYRKDMQESSSLIVTSIESSIKPIKKGQQQPKTLKALCQWRQNNFLNSETKMTTEPWSVGLTAVIENHQKEIEFFALTHTHTQPDFHQFSSFTFKLTPPKEIIYVSTGH